MSFLFSTVQLIRFGLGKKPDFFSKISSVFSTSYNSLPWMMFLASVQQRAWTQTSANDRCGSETLVSLVFLKVLNSSSENLFSYLGRGGDDDPLLDPRNNPNIRHGIVMIYKKAQKTFSLLSRDIKVLLRLSLILYFPTLDMSFVLGEMYLIS